MKEMPLMTAEELKHFHEQLDNFSKKCTHVTLLGFNANDDTQTLVATTVPRELFNETLLRTIVGNQTQEAILHETNFPKGH